MSDTQKPGFDVIVKFQQDDAHNLTMEASYQGETFDPEHIKTHCALDLLHKHFPDLVAQINGLPTDGDRFRALLEYSMLGQAEATRERFDQISQMQQDFEERLSLKADGARTPEEFRATADFILHALLDTAPVLTAPTAQPE
jgi:hypothetical protein